MSIDWHEQWALHAPNFQNGVISIDLGSSKIELTPGPGFGDLSHSTTRMMLNFLRTHSLNPIVIDIGAGSGILSLAAKALGTSTVYGIEIDPDAIEHAMLNARKNQLDVQFCLPQNFIFSSSFGPVTIAMNMIRSEQERAWNSLPILHNLSGNCFTSGILVEEKEEYLEQVKKRGWHLQSTLSENGWLAFHFKLFC